MTFEEFVEATQHAATPAEVFDILRSAVSSHGFNYVAFGIVSAPQHSPLSEGIPAPAIAVHYPEEWVRHYFRQGYEKIDPTLMLSPFTTKPLVWEDCRKRPELTDAQRRLFQEAYDMRLLDGVSFPLHGPMGGTYVLGLASSMERPDFRTHIPILRAYVYQFFAAYMEVSAPGANGVTLTQRERDCLLWSARGKSNWDIGTILHISEHTVDFHVRKAMAKLGAGNRIIAIVTAIRRGMIQP